MTYLVAAFAQVNLANPVRVQRVPLVRVDNHHKEAGIRMDHLRLVTGLQVPEDRGVVEEGQVDHVLALLELGRIHPAYLTSLQGELLVPTSKEWNQRA